MRKCILCAGLVVFIAFQATAQYQQQTLVQYQKVFKAFKVDVGMLYGIPMDDEHGDAFGFYLEPKYNLNDYLNFGLRMEWAVFASGSVGVSGTNASVKLEPSTVSSILFTNDYYFNTETVRPFMGLGLGLYRRGSLGVGTTPGSVEISTGSRSNLGISPRIGLNAGHFKVGASYHYAGEAITNYLAVNLGVEFGGGRIKRR